MINRNSLLLTGILVTNLTFAGTYPLSDLSKELASHGFKTGQYGTNILCVSSNASVICHPNSRLIQVNRRMIWMNAPILTEKDGSFRIASADLNNVLLPSIYLTNGKVRQKSRTITVVLDPGHGGQSPGASSPNKISEKSLVLDIAQMINKELLDSGLNVAFSRTMNTNVKNSDRPEKANALDADMFISIHMNASSNTNSAGIETYVLPAPDFDSTSGGNGSRDKCPGNDLDADNSRLAYIIHSAVLSETKANDRGIRRGRFEVLRTASSPAILIECGFLTNTEEATKLTDMKYRRSIAKGIANGIGKYAATLQPK